MDFNYTIKVIISSNSYVSYLLQYTDEFLAKYNFNELSKEGYITVDGIIYKIKDIEVFQNDIKINPNTTIMTQ